MRKVILVSAIITLFAVTKVNAQKGDEFSQSQDYTTAVGIKFSPFALSVKHFLNENDAIEGLGYFWSDGFRLTGLYEIHSDINSVQGLKWYVGPGVHLGFYGTRYGGGSTVGIDGVIGLDYKFEDAPVNLSLDWQPSFEFGNGYYNGFAGNWGGLGIRYTLQ